MHRDICMSPGQPGEGEGPEHLKVRQQRGEDPDREGDSKEGREEKEDKTTERRAEGETHGSQP